MPKHATTGSWKPWATKVGRQAKAIASTLVAAAGGTVLAALADGRITGQEWWGIAAVAAAAYGITFSVPNVPNRRAQIMPVPDARGGA